LALLLCGLRQQKHALANPESSTQGEDVMPRNVSKTAKSLASVTSGQVEELFKKKSAELHRKVDQTRDAYFGFIFPINRDDFRAVANALNIPNEAAQVLHAKGTAFSTFQRTGRSGGRSITNHIFGASILALRGKSLDTGLSSVTDRNLAEIVTANEDAVFEIAEARSSWFGRIFFPAAAFSNAIAVFGGKVKADVIYDLASKYGYAAQAGERKTVRGDFGIGVWLTLLGVAS
jgi:hypothetical protein